MQLQLKALGTARFYPSSKFSVGTVLVPSFQATFIGPAPTRTRTTRLFHGVRGGLFRFPLQMHRHPSFIAHERPLSCESLATFIAMGWLLRYAFILACVCIIPVMPSDPLMTG